MATGANTTFHDSHVSVFFQHPKQRKSHLAISFLEGEVSERREC